jgi:biotin operon repressor
VHRLVRGEARRLQRAAHRLRGGEELAEALSGKRLARSEALRGLREQGAEIQRLRCRIVISGGWRNDWATTQ